MTSLQKSSIKNDTIEWVFIQYITHALNDFNVIS